MIKPKTALAILAVCFGIAIWFVHDTLLLVFAGILLSLVLRGAAEKLSSLTRLRVTWALWITVFAIVAITGIGITLLGSAVIGQFEQLRNTLSTALSTTIHELRSTPVGQWVAGNLANLAIGVPDTAHLLTRATGILSSMFGVLAALLIVLFVGLAGALEPRLYVDGFVQLFPASHRARIRAVIVEIGHTLHIWLAARLLTMVVTGILVTIGLTVLRVPLAGILGVLAAVFAFIPNIGAFVAAAPAVLLAFAASPTAALGVIGMYVIVHITDDLIVSPIVERQVVKLPPILTLVAQVVLGVGAGAVGIMLAAPLVASAIVLVRRLWVEDIADLSLPELPSLTSRREPGGQ